jgi:hypothetical protein
MCASIFWRYSLRAYSGVTSRRALRFQVDQQAGSRNFGRSPSGSSTWNSTTSLPRKRSGSTVLTIFRAIVEIRNHHHHAAAAQEFLKMERTAWRNRCARRARRAFMAAAAAAAAGPGAWKADVVAHFVVENDQAGGVALVAIAR